MKLSRNVKDQSISPLVKHSGLGGCAAGRAGETTDRTDVDLVVEVDRVVEVLLHIGLSTVTPVS